MSEFATKLGSWRRGKLVNSGTIEELGRRMARRRMLGEHGGKRVRRHLIDEAHTGVEHVEELTLGAGFDFAGTDEGLDELLAIPDSTRSSCYGNGAA